MKLSNYPSSLFVRDIKLSSTAVASLLSLSISLIFFSQWGRDHQTDHHHIARISLTFFFLFFLRECKSPEEFAKRISSTAKQSRELLAFNLGRLFTDFMQNTHTHPCKKPFLFLFSTRNRMGSYVCIFAIAEPGIFSCGTSSPKCRWAREGGRWTAKLNHFCFFFFFVSFKTSNNKIVKHHHPSARASI